jgi:hypothetical protein
MALTARAAGFSNVTQAGRFLQFYGWTETGATVVLVPVKMADDIHKIESDRSLTDEQRKILIEDVKLGALQTGLMMIGSATASRMGGHAPSRSGDFDESAQGLQRQIELLELEGFGQYKSLQDRRLLDANGNWTAAAHTLGPAPHEIEAPLAVGKPSPTVEEPVAVKSQAPAEQPSAAAEKPPSAVEEPIPGSEKPTSAVEELIPTSEKPVATAEPDVPVGAAAKPTPDGGAVEQRQAELDDIKVEITKIKEKRDAAEKIRLEEKDALERTARAKYAQAIRLDERARATQDPERRAAFEDEAARLRDEHERAKQRQIDNQEEVNALERDRADADKALATAKENLLLAQHGRRISDTKAVTARLQAHVDAAVVKFASGGLVLSDRQAAAVAGGGSVEMNRGNVLDAAVKLAILNDPDLAGLKVTLGVYGPDIYDPLTKRWWDITTPGEWRDHVAKYTAEYGTGMLLSTHAAIPK